MLTAAVHTRPTVKEFEIHRQALGATVTKYAMPLKTAAATLPALAVNQVSACSAPSYDMS